MRDTPGGCPCCGGGGERFSPVLWPELVDEWGLSPEEHSYVDRQQGQRCATCGASLRSRALAMAILRTLGARGPLTAFVRSVRGRLLRVLEVNGAGELSPVFARKRRHELRSYPELDMMAMNLPDDTYDLVIHSDTLEHIPDPVKGLSECLRVLKPGGACCFTVPTIVGRLTRSRDGLPPSYHGNESERPDDYLVRTEYGADAWRHVLQAGFAECRIVSLDHPAAHAMVGVKAGRP